MFKKYSSNTSCATGTSYVIGSTDGKKSYRIYVRPEAYGNFAWRFFFINSVNSTFAQGEVSHANLSGGNWTVHSALIGVSSSLDPTEPLKNVTPVTFGTKPSKSVTPDEAFWSDEVMLEIADGYLVWEWEVEGENIPSMPDDLFSSFVLTENGWVHEWNKPIPALFGCDRAVKKRIAFLGDSITAGCGTPKDKYEMWVGRIADAMASEYSVWNLGLGYGRGSDCASDKSWLFKGKQADVAVVTYGVNDIISGAYKQGRGSTAGEIVEYIEKIVTELQTAGVEVILATIPPFSFDSRQRWEWRCANMGILMLAKQKGCRVYDIEASLDTEPLKGDYPNGDHPNSEGCRLAYEKFKQTFFIDGEWKI